MIPVPEDTIRAAAQGDHAAFRSIYDASSAYVYHLALRCCGNPQDAEEVTQDVFIQLNASLESFQFQSSFKTWVYRITVNKTLNVCRKRSRERNIRGAWFGARPPAPVAHGPDKLLSEDYDNIRSGLLARLAPDLRACLLLREMEGLSYAEISEALNIKLNTVRTRLKRARETLLDIIRKEGIQHEM